MIFGSCQVVFKQIIKNNSSFKTSPPEDDNLLSIFISSGGGEKLLETEIPSMAIGQGGLYRSMFNYLVEGSPAERELACLSWLSSISCRASQAPVSRGIFR